MEFVYFCFKKYGFTDDAINIFRNIYSKALATLVLNGKPSKVLKDLRECLRQGGCGSMGIFCSGVNPLLQLLEHKLEGITIYEAPVLGPVTEKEKHLSPHSIWVKSHPGIKMSINFIQKFVYLI